MLFNSYQFLLAFLPLTLALYFGVGRWSPRSAMGLLTLASLVFYGWWDARYVLLILGSIAFNFTFGSWLLRLAAQGDARRIKPVLASALIVNLAALGTFKYFDFFLESVNAVAGAQLPLLHLVLPLGISFFTFTQIAFLVDASHGKVDSLTPVNYTLFVSFFPHLIAGPILHHREMMPQFSAPAATRFNADHFALGLFLFCLGLVKKILVADQFAPIASAGFAGWQGLDMAAAWMTSIAYTLQLYFDFSGYTDMALGLAWMFNIRLPQNFDAPYRATSIQDFWRRWHITLSRFLRDYLYVPLGGDRHGRMKTLRNVFITFLLGGLWHGAGWTFVIWGALHGAALVGQRLWNWRGGKMKAWQGWALTMLFVNFAWIYFRATSVEQANGIVLRMLGLNGALPTMDFARLTGEAARAAQGLFGSQSAPVWLVAGATMAALAVTWLAPNSIQLAARFRPSLRWGLVCGLALAVCLQSMDRPAEFLYFNF